MSRPQIWEQAFELFAASDAHESVSQAQISDQAFDTSEPHDALNDASDAKEISFREITDDMSHNAAVHVPYELHEGEGSPNNPDLSGEIEKKESLFKDATDTLDFLDGNNIKSAKGLYYEALRNLLRNFHLIKEDQDFPIDAAASYARNMVSHIRVETNSWMQLLYKIEKDTATDAVMHVVKHSLDAAIIAIRLGIGMKMKDDQLVALALQTCLHDVGMLKMPAEIMKQEKLSRKDIALIKKHPEFGYEILSKLEEPYNGIAEIVYQVHERYDGSGYPRGLKGQDISEHSLIIGIADMFGALLHPRPYRPRRLPFEAIKEIIATAKEQFPKHIIKALVNEFSAFPEGLFVKLNSHEVGKVITVNRLAPLSPVVKILYNADGKLQNAKTVDLMKDHCLYITSGFYGEED